MFLAIAFLLFASALLVNIPAVGAQAGTEPHVATATAATGLPSWKEVVLNDVAGLAELAPELTAVNAAVCSRTITAHVVALDQSFFYNRMGAYNPGGMIYALRGDVVAKDTGLSEAEGGVLLPGNVKLRSDKRPRPLTLRMNEGDCLQVEFQNLLAPQRTNSEQPITRSASFFVNGLNPVNSIADLGGVVGENSTVDPLRSGSVAPGDATTYTLYGEYEGTYLMYNRDTTFGAEGNAGTAGFGLFGAVNIEPAGAEWYRSQVTYDDMQLATTGQTPGGQPIINYDAVYPTGHKFAGLPILSMLDGNEIVHSDLNAVITGLNRGNFARGTYADNALYPARDAPFREFTIIFHDEIFAVQAFDLFDDPMFADTLSSVVDGFAINYGTGGIGAEIIANRLGVGPMWNCTGCKYEEFFLSSWAIADPAMVVDIPANADLNADGQPDPGAKATRALYPDDPSNVYHGYLNDNTKIRNLSVGKEAHIFHLHAHQWQNSPESAESNYLDSQAIGPGAAFTYEIPYGGGGNRNKTAGDSIFHCHFYPHFAQGMWSLWRVHDTFEAGTELDSDGRPLPGSRALPDGEIPSGTPIPALIPLPGSAMPLMPGDATVTATDANNDGSNDSSQITFNIPDNNGDGLFDANPGYPFFIAGVAGHRAPTPPLDVVDDGGLPRHVITGGEAETIETPTDFSKELTSIEVDFLPEEGTVAEKTAMAFHARRFYTSYTPEGTRARFETNGLPPVAGAPYADPCRQDNGKPMNHNNVREYKAAVFQMDVVLNKVGWHVPQQRILALWEDIIPTLNGTRPPQPLVMRLSVLDCANYYHTNLTPSYYELDDYQVRTPTDIIGQHIHLVKFDVTSSDGSANGFNYEDGTFSPDEVRERINAIRDHNSCIGDAVSGGDARDGTNACPLAEAHPFFGAGPYGDWLGARTTVQRWFADPLLNSAWDKGLGTIFTHDHFAPSTHQQVGLYGTVLVEPQHSTWQDPETGEILGTRVTDGGPTSWQANILTQSGDNSFREFYLESSDFVMAYDAGRGIDGNGNPIPDFTGAINPPIRDVPPNQLDGDIFFFPPFCPNGLPRPCAEAIAADDPGTYTVNYRNEPVGMRVYDPNAGAHSHGTAGDLANAFSSTIVRDNPAMNVQPNVYPALTSDVLGGDPYTPLLRAYMGDEVRMRMQIGGQEEEHSPSINGVKWRREGLMGNSGWINALFMGISEYAHLNFQVPVITDITPGDVVDYLYTMGAQVDDYWNGTWGLLRSYSTLRNDLLPLPNNPIGPNGLTVSDADMFPAMCVADAPVAAFDITAVTAADALPNGTLIYNSRTTNNGPLQDPTALLYVHTEDLDANGHLLPGVPIEPLILRVNAGDCVQVTLRNNLPAQIQDLDGYNAYPPIIKKAIVDGGVVTFNANDVGPSSQVGLHPQLLAYDAGQSDGMNVGRNPVQTIGPGEVTTYTWYAGHVEWRWSTGTEMVITGTPVEFGPVNLMPADKFEQSSRGLIGTLIVEPEGATWAEDIGTHAAATVTKTNGDSFREFVAVLQNDINMRFGDGSLVPNIAGEGSGVPEDSQDSGQKAINYTTEPLWFRKGIDADAPFELVGEVDAEDVYANEAIGDLDPETPIFTVEAGTPVRFHVVEPGGHPRIQSFIIQGHAWQAQPYTTGSTGIGDNPKSPYASSQIVNPASHFSFVLKSAGGDFAVPGDYLYGDMASFGNFLGMWGIMRVTPPAAAVNQPPTANADTTTTQVDTAVLLNVITNDTDTDGTIDPATVAVTTNPANGTVTNHLDGTVTYAPNTGFTGPNTFQYTVTDDGGAVSNVATVTVTMETVGSGDTITVTAAQYDSRRGNWLVRGTTAVPGPGNSVTVYIGATAGGTALGTTDVDTAGSWTLRLRGATMEPDATNMISITSSQNGILEGAAVSSPANHRNR
ncbi:MAG: Ig-like domain-containing protein [Anaerolineae bacterium]